MSAQPDDLVVEIFHTGESPYEIGYAQGYRDGFGAGADSERERIARALAEDVARRDTPKPAVEPILTRKGEPGWISRDTGRVLKAVV